MAVASEEGACIPMRHRLSLLSLVLLGVLIAACSGSSSQTSHPASTPTSTPLLSGVRVLLVPAPGTGTPTQAALRSAGKTLSLRLAAFGLKNASVVELTSGNQPALQVEVPH